MLLKFIFLLALATFYSCTNLPRRSYDQVLVEYNESDYIDHLWSLEKSFLESNKKIIYKIQGSEKNFVLGIVNKIIRSNETFLKKRDLDFELFIISDDAPFYFSLPGPHIFLSRGLIEKYIKSEKTLVATIAFEIIKSVNGLYRKNIVVPVGNISVKRIISLLEIRSEFNIEIAKWTYVVLKRSGHDPISFLNLLQMENKNSADFGTMYSELRHIPEIEFAYKKFLIEKEKGTGLSEEDGKNSSPEFYKLIEKAKRGIL